MTSITYSEIFASFYVKLEAYDLFEPDMSDEVRNELLCQYLHSSVAEPYVRRLFSTFTYTDPHKKSEESKDDEDTTTTDDGTTSTEDGSTTTSGEVTNSDESTSTADNNGTTDEQSGDSTTPSEEETTSQEEIVDGTIEYELKKPTSDDNADKDFVIEVLVYGMLYQWCLKFVYSATQLQQLIGTSQEKWYSQSTHNETNRNIQQDIYNHQRALIRDRGYVNNSWLSGEMKARKESSSTTTS